jgi:hypothetical protein
MVKRKSMLFLASVLVFGLISYGLAIGAPPEGLVFLMTFDEGQGDVVGDSSVFGNNGTVEGKADWIEGKFRGGFQFDGATHITVPNADPLDKLTHPMSVGAWVNPDILGDWRNIIEMDAEGSGGWKMGFHDSAAIVWTTYRVQDFISQTPIETEVWTHVAATWDGAEAIVYVNGEPDSPMSGGGLVDTTILPSLDLGYRRTTNASFFEGGMDEVFIFDRVLEQNECKRLQIALGKLLTQ